MLKKTDSRFVGSWLSIRSLKYIRLHDEHAGNAQPCVGLIPTNHSHRPTKLTVVVLLYKLFERINRNTMTCAAHHNTHQIPASRFEFNRPCINLATGQSARRIGVGTRTSPVSTCCRDPAGQSEFFLAVSRLKTFNRIY